ncbi:MAG TPA: glycosyltransferase [Blastocatellia bacterium]|nr:glycosyltransferase [Blastocatellia bacterium]
MTGGRTIRLLAVVEAATVTGPVKNLLDFATRARNLAASPRIETTIATFRRTAATDSSRFVAAAEQAGVEVEIIPERFRFDPRVIALLRDVVTRREPQIVQTHSVKSHFLMRLSGVWRQRPWAAFHHGYTSTDLKMRAYNQLDRWSLRRAARVVTVSQVFAGQLTRRGVEPERISVLHNSIDPGYAAAVSERDVSELRARLGITDRDKVILSVGRLSREKGHTDLVKALKYLVDQPSQVNAKLVIVGDGPERPRIERTAAALGIQDRIILAGRAGDARPYFALADVFALPSHSEGSPNVLLEAMAAGVPVVATNVGGVPEIVTHNVSALLVRPHDPQSIAASIGLALADLELARGLTARARDQVITRHSPENRLLSLVKLYAGLVGGAVASTAQVA